MSAHDLSTDWTADQVLSIPDDGNRYEVLDGELFVTPAPSWSHQFVVGAIFTVLGHTLLLAIEVLSPSTMHADRQRKRLIYQSERVPEYWIVDADTRVVERWRPDDTTPETIGGTLLWQPSEACEPLRIALPDLFARALDPE